MGGSDENNPGLGAIRSMNMRGGVKMNANGKAMMGTAIGQNRRALSDINRNIVKAQRPPNVAAVDNSGVSVSDVNGMCEKKQSVPVHRPITRKFAAQLLKKQHQTVAVFQEPAKYTNLPKDINHDVIDLDDIHENNDFTEPVSSTQQKETMLDDTNRMIVEEIEMEDIEEELVTDIDSADKHNPLAVAEYVDDLYAHYKKSEGSFCALPNYMDQQADINDRMRSILIDWLIEVHYKFELMEETLYLTVNLIDRFLSAQPVARKKLQLVGITAMLVACKYEEVTVPVVEDMILISDKAYTRKEVLEMEKLMMNTLQFNLSIPTAYVFLRRFLKAAISDTKLEFLASYIIELSLVEYEMLKFPPSLLAAAAVYTAGCSIIGSKQWSRTSKWYSEYSEDQLLECAKLMVVLHQKAPTSRLTGVYRKYSLSKYGYAVQSEPAIFLLDVSK